MIYEAGADDRIRTGDLLLTKQLLYQLSYIGKICKKPYGFTQSRQFPNSWKPKGVHLAYTELPPVVAQLRRGVTRCYEGTTCLIAKFMEIRERVYIMAQREKSMPPSQGGY